MSRVTNIANDVTFSGDDVTPEENDALLKAVEAIEMGCGADVGLTGEAEPWTRELVMERLEEAIKLVHRTAGRVGPRGYGSSMPAYLYSELDLWYQQTQTDEERARGDFERNRVRRPATREQIRQAEEALEWPMRFVENVHTRKALHLWMMAKAVRVPFSSALKSQGMALRTGIARRDRAIAVIALRLMSLTQK